MIIGALIGWFIGLVLFLTCAFVGQREVYHHNESPLMINMYGRAVWKTPWGLWIVIILTFIVTGALIGYVLT